jgi:CxxC motif-containing protein (DUF1111 family)
MIYKYLFLAFVFVLTLMACVKDKVSMNGAEMDFVLPAGKKCTVYDETSYAFSYKIKGLSSDQSLNFFVGNSFFNQNWVESPSSTTARDGLGPLLNTPSCSSCHFRDGRGAPFSGQGLLMRLSQSGNVADPVYGGQFQDNAISTALREGNIEIVYSYLTGVFGDGTSYMLRSPSYNLVGLNYGSLSPSLMISPRVGGQMIGLGLLEIIDESDILVYEDEFDSDADGISGRANYAFDVYNNTTMLGRFGWKSNTPTIGTQVAAAFNGDIGIKSSYFPNENHTSAQSSLDGLPDGGIIEITDEDLEKVILYCRTLAVPIRRNQLDGNVKVGEIVFRSLNCNKCHVEQYRTGNTGSIQSLKNVLIRPYTDLLLHDMGDELADNRPDQLANGNEWRTAPLWGLGLIETVNSHTYLLHDGRARSIEEAILWHGGEGATSRDAYKNLKIEQRQQLLDFLNSL